MNIKSKWLNECVLGRERDEAERERQVALKKYKLKE